MSSWPAGWAARAARADLARRDQRLRQAIEQRLHARGIGPVAHQGRVRARTQREPQRVDQQALAGTRLARQHVQPGMQRQPRGAHEHEVLDDQLLEHQRVKASR